MGLDGAADRMQDARDLAAEEDEGDDCHDRDERKDQRVLRETLTFLVGAEEIDECGKERHGVVHLLPSESPPQWRELAAPRTATPTVGAQSPSVKV